MDPPLDFTVDEHSAIADVTKALLADPEVDGVSVRPREVAIVTMVSKCRVDKAVEKYKQFLDVLKEYNLTVASLYEDTEVLAEKGIINQFKNSYQVCGEDNGGRGIMWIASKQPAPVDQEQAVVHAGVLYWMAVHSDMKTLRDGCTFVIDTSKQTGKPVGNERKLQKTWQALPLRPQNLFIVGASWIKRIFINSLIKFASVFSNSKVLARIRFVEMPAVRETVPASSMPHNLGGEERSSVEAWVPMRLGRFQDFAVKDTNNEETKEDGDVKL